MLEQIREDLFRMQDLTYRDFQSRLLPTVAPETLIGVRTPALRDYAKRLGKTEDAAAFLQKLPHTYFDENQLHAFLLCEMKDFERCMDEVNRFLPYIDNWATCDQMSPKVFKKHRAALLAQIPAWLASEKSYTVRFVVGMLMQHFLDEDFAPAYPDMVAALRSEEYYVNMMIAWYFATALAKQYEAALPFLENRRLSPWTHNKAIRKAVESFRVTPEQKAYLRSLKIKGGKA